MHSLLSKQGADKEARELLLCYERSIIFLQRIIAEKCAILHYEPSIREQTERGMYCPTYYGFYEHTNHKSSSQIYPVFKWKLTSDDEQEAIEECINRIVAQIKQHLAHKGPQPGALEEAEELLKEYSVRAKFMKLVIENNLALPEYYPYIKSTTDNDSQTSKDFILGYVHKLHKTAASNFPEFVITAHAKGIEEAYSKSITGVVDKIKTYRAR